MKLHKQVNGKEVLLSDSEDAEIRKEWDLNRPDINKIKALEYAQAMRKLFDDVAKQKDYDNAMSIVSYYASTNPLWAKESQIFIAWRDACWTIALMILEEVRTGQRAAPSIEKFLNELPIINWG